MVIFRQSAILCEVSFQHQPAPRDNKEHKDTCRAKQLHSRTVRPGTRLFLDIDFQTLNRAISPQRNTNFERIASRPARTRSGRPARPTKPAGTRCARPTRPTRTKPVTKQNKKSNTNKTSPARASRPDNTSKNTTCRLRATKPAKTTSARLTQPLGTKTKKSATTRPKQLVSQ